ncbi:MAG: two-component system, chemotaxis family, protein-glutamate methylesterase/glutaminase, partial [Alphaproteobacteria bacterium]|nr:two-component system, chemotaxis family, protein-glutamate methylesterase/glutaminase [Alphaproteobacteria bacterium]
SVAAAVTSPVSTVTQQPIRVMVVDDAVVVRGLVSRWVNAEPDLKIVASLRTGQDALDQLDLADPEVILLDVEMPVLDGMAALPLLLQRRSNLAVIMVSTVTRRNAEVTLKALTLGAADYVSKPETNHEVTTSETFRYELIEKIRHLGWRRRGRKFAPSSPGLAERLRKPFTLEGTAPDGNVLALPTLHAPMEIKLRPLARSAPRILLIGASTGGPQALDTVLSSLGSVIDRAPVLITQHMPPTFTTILAEHLTRVSGRPAREATHGEPILAGNVYVAPGGRHMQVARVAGAAVAQINNGPPVNFCKPAVDPLFGSAAKVWGGWNLAVVLTGMGSDGTEGAAEIVAAGGNVLAQDEATSVVWGMPGSVAHAGHCAAVLPLDRIAEKITRLFRGDRQ